jgi:hypothetical protein
MHFVGETEIGQNVYQVWKKKFTRVDSSTWNPEEMAVGSCVKNNMQNRIFGIYFNSEHPTQPPKIFAQSE